MKLVIQGCLLIGQWYFDLLLIHYFNHC